MSAATARAFCHERAHLRRTTLTTPIRDKQSCAQRSQDDSFVAERAVSNLLLLRCFLELKEK